MPGSEAELDDDASMPFGEHVGERMSDVPADYLLWLWDDGVHAQPERPIHKYIRNTWKALLSDSPDTIVKNPPK